MKIWLKYLIALALGSVLALVAPVGGSFVQALVDVARNLATYIIMPLFFLSIPMAAHELHEDKKLLRVTARTAGYALAAVVGLSLLGVLGAFALGPKPIPLSGDTTPLAATLPGFGALLTDLFPADALSILAGGFKLMPLAIFGLVLGLAFSYDRSVTKPVVGFFDAASRLLWQINSFMVEIYPLFLIVLSMASLSSVIASPRMGSYLNLILVVSVEAVVAIFGILPLVMFLLDRSSKPYRALYGLLGPALLGLAGGGGALPVGALTRHVKENLGVRRRAGAVSLPLALFFGRAGSAMVTATAFYVVLSSYSYLGFDAGTVFWMLLMVPVSAILLGAVPASGPVAALLFLSAAYGGGFESGYLIMVPAAVPLMAVGSVVDAIVAGFITRLAAAKEGYAADKPARHFI
ncbi:MAG: dicarboxylate/amino acid:cation symporter [Spirochaetia bacterium]|nr:dicarboxylate/amino acid:cation symporter [Spirochaetia bacterium]